MRFLRYAILPVILATVWIAGIEFLRNQLLFLHIWENHYAQLGLDFPGAMINGAIWGLWSLVFAAAIYVLTKRYEWYAAAAIAWVFGFVMMWIVVGNLNVLPYRLLPFAVPMSMLEALGASFVCGRLGRE